MPAISASATTAPPAIAGAKYLFRRRERADGWRGSGSDEVAKDGDVVGAVVGAGGGMGGIAGLAGAADERTDACGAETDGGGSGAEESVIARRQFGQATAEVAVAMTWSCVLQWGQRISIASNAGNRKGKRFLAPF
jgi:hypothetical protein